MLCFFSKNELNKVFDNVQPKNDPGAIIIFKNTNLLGVKSKYNNNIIIFKNANLLGVN